MNNITLKVNDGIIFENMIKLSINSIMNKYFLLTFLLISFNSSLYSQCIVAEITNVNQEQVEEGNTTFFNLCPGETLTMQAIASNEDGPIDNPTYSWYIDETYYSDLQTFTQTFVTPGGYIVKLMIEDYEGCEMEESLDFYVRVSTVPSIDLSVNPSIVCPGVTSTVGAATSSDVSFSGEINTGSWESVNCLDEFSEATYLPDGSGASYSTDIYLGCFGDGQTLTDVNDIISVDINMEHSYSGDLDIYLTSPNGVQVTLFQQAGGSTWFGEATDGDLTETNPGLGYDYGWSMNPDYNGTMVDGVANNTIPDPAGGFSNILAPTTYLPVGDFSDFLGSPINGTWTITVTDNIFSDNGWIFSWGIQINQNIVPSSWSFENSIIDEYFINSPTVISNSGTSISVEPNVGSNTYYYEVVDNFGCTFSEPIVITGTSYINVSENISNEYCGADDGEVSLNISEGTPPYSVLWGNGTQSLSLSNLSEGTYTYTIEDDLGCEQTNNIIIQNSELGLLFDLVVISDRCNQGIGSIEILPLNGSSPYSFSYNGVTSNTNLIANLSQDEYYIEISDDFGCDGSKTIDLENILGPTANFNQSHDTVTYVDGLVEFISLSSASVGANLENFQWTFGNGLGDEGLQTEFNFVQIGNFPVALTVTDDGGCSDTYLSPVVVVEDYWAWAPSAFTPNGDGINDIFSIKFDKIIESTLKVFIYDRWGKLVYQSNGNDSGWDGIRQDNGIKADVSSYKYYASFNTYRNKLQEKTGVILLLN